MFISRSIEAIHFQQRHCYVCVQALLKQPKSNNIKEIQADTFMFNCSAEIIIFYALYLPFLKYFNIAYIVLYKWLYMYSTIAYIQTPVLKSLAIIAI